MLKLSNLEILFLSALSRGDNYALGLIDAVKQMTNGEYIVKVGSLYSTLARMEKKSLVKSSWGEDRPEERGGARRRYYKITGLGETTLKQTQTSLSKIWGLVPTGSIA